MEKTFPAYRQLGPTRYRETSGLYYEDFEIGDTFEHRPGRTILDVDNTWFTLLTMNTQELHFDAAYAAKTEWKKPLVDSTLTLALLTGMSVRTVSAKVVANLGWDKVKCTHPVFVGRHPLCGEHGRQQAGVQESADPGARHRLHARRQPGRRRGHDLRAHDAHLPPRPLARRSRQLLTGAKKENHHGQLPTLPVEADHAESGRGDDPLGLQALHGHGDDRAARAPTRSGGSRRGRRDPGSEGLLHGVHVDRGADHPSIRA